MAQRRLIKRGMLLLLLVPSVSFSAALPRTADVQIDGALRLLLSSSVEERSTAFYSIIHAGLSPGWDSKLAVADGVLAIANSGAEGRARLVAALTRLLETETDFQQSGAAPATEDYSNYYGDVIHAVTTLRDPASLPVLMRCINTGGMAQRTLAGFGAAALNQGIKALPNADEETRHSLFRMFSAMSEPRNLNNVTSKGSEESLLNILLIGARDANPQSRRVSVEGLAHFSSSAAVDVLNRLAVSDPYKVTDPNGSAHYPVREAAARALQATR